MTYKLHIKQTSERWLTPENLATCFAFVDYKILKPQKTGDHRLATLLVNFYHNMKLRLKVYPFAQALRGCQPLEMLLYWFLYFWITGNRKR